MVVVVYDISDEKRLSKVARYLEKVGVRVQNSVFELDMSLKEASKIYKYLQKLINIDEDLLFLYSIKDKEDIAGKTGIERVF